MVIKNAFTADVEGIRYDSSIFFGRKDIGDTESPRFFEKLVFGIYTLNGLIVEYLITTKSLGRRETYTKNS